MSAGKTPMTVLRHGQKRSFAISAVLVGLAWSLTASAQVQKCVDPATGKITFSDRGCSTGEAATAINVQPANSIDSSQYRQQAFEQPQTYATPEPERKGARVTVVGGNNDADRERNKLCKQASTPHRGAQGLTAAQLSAAAQLCAGASVPMPATRGSDQSSGAQSAPAPMASCDNGGCWDTKGLRYNKGADTTYFPANGGPACQYIGGNMIYP